MYTEMSEADAVVSLAPLSGHRFGYALANGIVGVYGGHETYWRIKVKRYAAGRRSFSYCIILCCQGHGIQTLDIFMLAFRNPKLMA